MAQDVTTPADSELIRQGASRIRELKADLAAGYYIPTGTIFPFAGSVAPTAWLLCDGSAVSRTTFAALFALIDTSWGVGDGVTTFNVPDFRGRTLIGAGAGGGLTARSIAQFLGEERHLLVTDEIPAHSHGVQDSGHGHSITDPTHTHGVTDPTHTHVLDGGTNGGSGRFLKGATTPGGTATETSNASSTGVSVNANSTGITLANNNTGITTVNTGGGSTHNNMQPSAVVNFMIKAY